MTKIEQITTNSLQKFSVSLTDGTLFSLTIYYRPMQLGWFISNITYGSFVLNGLRIVTTPNILNQWRNLIPFGLGCIVAGNREPTQQQDFESGAANLYVLTQEEVKAFGDILSG